MVKTRISKTLTSASGSFVGKNSINNSKFNLGLSCFTSGQVEINYCNFVNCLQQN
jgi:hypothetical protein